MNVTLHRTVALRCVTPQCCGATHRTGGERRTANRGHDTINNRS